VQPPSKASAPFACEAAFGGEPVASVLHAFALYVRMMAVALHLETHEVLQVEAARSLQPFEQFGRRSHHAKVDVLRCASACEAKFEHESALENDCIPGFLMHAGEESLEHKELPATGEVDPRCGRRS
jgi:hypothetical protein